MDWQRIKEKVTEQVIAQLQADGLAANVQNVQELVLQAAEERGPKHAEAMVPAASAAPVAQAATLPACQPGPDFHTDVLVVVAGPVCDQVVAVIDQVSRARKVTVVSSGPSARLAEVKACQLLCEGGELTARRLVDGAGTIIVPALSTATAAKVAGLIGDCFASAVLVQAALAGKKVSVARESFSAPAGATWAIRRKVEEVVGSLRQLGFSVTDLNILAGTSQGRTTTGGYVPAYRAADPVYKPHPAVAASRAARAQTAATLDSTDYDHDLARMIDHTLLKPEATAEQVTKLCNEAKTYSFMSVCINPGWVPLAAKLLAGSPVKVCTVIGFPLGATTTAAKAAETADAIANGATEVDMVLNIGALKSSQYDVVQADMKAVVAAARGNALTKVILETGLLTQAEKTKACELAVAAGLDFVKTSTGFGPGGATVEDVALMRQIVGPNIGVKASGGIRDFDTAQAMVRAGANRIGASASINIVKRVKQAAGAVKEKY